MTSTTSTASKLYKDEFQNWVAVGYALRLMNEGIRPYITREMSNLHNNIILGPGLAPCVCHDDKTRKNNRWHDMSTCDWAKALKAHHGSEPKWYQSDVRKWTDPRLGSWEMAKLFMSDLGKQKAVVVDACSTDTTGLLNMLCWCKVFGPLRPYAEQVRDVRNQKWAHNPTLELSLADKNIAISAMEQLLSTGALSTDSDAQNALLQIRTINKHFDVQKHERKVLIDYTVEFAAYRQEMTDKLHSYDKKTKQKQENNKKPKRTHRAYGYLSENTK